MATPDVEGDSDGNREVRGALMGTLMLRGTLMRAVI